MNEVKRTAILLFLSTRKELTPEEEGELMAWRRQSRENEKLFRQVNDKDYVRAEIKKIYASRTRSFEKLKVHFPYLGNDQESDHFRADEFDIPESRNGEPASEVENAKTEFSDPEVSRASYWDSLLTGLGVTEEQWEESDRLAREWGSEYSQETVSVAPKWVALIYKVGRVAATIVIILGLGWLFMTKTQSKIHPGGFKAGLLSFNGVYPMFIDLNNGYSVARAGFTVRRDTKGKVIFLAPNNPGARKDQFNILTTPRGGEFPIQFPDGTNMWINAASRLEYPANFSMDTIRVIFEGEAYIEVPQNSKTVFEIYVHGSLMRSNGMKTNIRAYPEEIIFRTTLLDGSAWYRVNRNHNNSNYDVQLHPGEQVQVAGDTVKALPAPDFPEVMAWRNGRIIFHEQTLPTIMRAISRWYDADIVFTGTPTDKKYNLNVPRDADISWLLFTLEIRGVECKVDGTTIKVTQNKP